MYFSDYLHKCLQYTGSKRIIMSRVLMGNVDTSTTRGQGILPGFHSKAVNINKNGMCEIIVIDQEAQIQPLFQFDCKIDNGTIPSSIMSLAAPSTSPQAPINIYSSTPQNYMMQTHQQQVNFNSKLRIHFKINTSFRIMLLNPIPLVLG